MIDISKIDDIIQLKAIAYDLLREREKIQSDFDKVMFQMQKIESVNTAKDQ